MALLGVFEAVWQFKQSRQEQSTVKLIRIDGERPAA